MASRDPHDLAPEALSRWLRMERILSVAGVDAFLTTTLRSPEEQQALYEQGRSVPGPRVTNARAWESWHQPWMHGKALAFDIAFRPAGRTTGATWSGPWDFVGAVGVFVGLEWGGNWTWFKDRPHFQYTGGWTLAELRRETGLERGGLA